ncbi:MAG: molybdenum cofactor guanylyltransferase [Candidatus Hadarchaeum sp.]
MMPKVSAVILAGGKSQRLGFDKSLLQLNGEWLLERIIKDMAAFSDDPIVIANAKPALATLPARIIPDIYPGSGPLGGIYTGLQAMHYHRGVFVACDMPFLNMELLRYMILLATDFDVVIPRIASEVEPLHAIYSKDCLPAISQALERGERRVVSFFPQVRVRYVEQEEIDILDPQHLSFFNINTVEDLELARQVLRTRAIQHKPTSWQKHKVEP